MERKCNNLPQKYNARVAETEKTFPSNVNANSPPPPPLPLNYNNLFVDVFSLPV